MDGLRQVCPSSDDRPNQTKIVHQPQLVDKPMDYSMTK